MASAMWRMRSTASARRSDSVVVTCLVPSCWPGYIVGPRDTPVRVMALDLGGGRHPSPIADARVAPRTEQHLLAEPAADVGRSDEVGTDGLLAGRAIPPVGPRAALAVGAIPQPERTALARGGHVCRRVRRGDGPRAVDRAGRGLDALVKLALIGESTVLAHPGERRIPAPITTLRRIVLPGTEPSLGVAHASHDRRPIPRNDVENLRQEVRAVAGGRRQLDALTVVHGRRTGVRRMSSSISRSSSESRSRGILRAMDSTSRLRIAT